MGNKEDAERHFPRDIANHRVTIKRDDGVYRHVVLAEPGTRNMMFELITYPGGLLYTGDMGTFVFERLTDMFEFFRGRRPMLSYWAEKCRAGVVKEASEAAMLEAVAEYVSDFAESHGLDDDAKADLLAEARDDAETDSVECFLDWASGYSLDVETPEGERKFTMPDAWECEIEDYTYRFYWCCMAIAWGIAKYDEAKSEAKPCP